MEFEPQWMPYVERETDVEASRRRGYLEDCLAEKIAAWILERLGPEDSTGGSRGLTRLMRGTELTTGRTAIASPDASEWPRGWTREGMGTSIMTIRPYEDADERAVIALWGEVLPDDAPHNDPATVIRKKLAAGGDLFLVATVGPEVVGTVMGGYDGHRGWVYGLAVLPGPTGGKGSAPPSSGAWSGAWPSCGCPKVNLQVRAANAGVVPFYEKLGYAVEDRISMGRRLDPRPAR